MSGSLIRLRIPIHVIYQRWAVVILLKSVGAGTKQHTYTYDISKVMSCGPCYGLCYCVDTPNLPTNTVDFTGFDSSTNLKFTGWNSQAHRGFTGQFESSNVSRNNISREIGRKQGQYTPLFTYSLVQTLSLQCLSDMLKRHMFQTIWVCLYFLF